MKKLLIILFVSISFLIILPGCPHCKDNDCTDVEIAKVNIADSTANWLPYSGYDTLRFVNSNGFHATFIGGGYQNSSFPVHFSDYDYLCGDPM